MESEEKPKLKISDIGTKRWYLNYQFHREDGPAVIYSSGEEVWYRHGEKYTPTAHELMLGNLEKNQG